MVDLDKSPDTPYHLRFGLTKGPSLAAMTLMNTDIIPNLPLEVRTSVDTRSFII